MRRKYRYFVCDFETTVYEGQEYTEVWAAACVEMYTEDVKIFHSIEEQFDYFVSLDCNIVAFYHNLKFDGTFWLDYLLTKKRFKQATNPIGEEANQVEWQKEQMMLNNTFKYAISDRGQWYTITIKTKNRFIEMRDSLKLLPFSVKRIGESFKTKHKKLEMEYVGFRYAGCEITDKEKEYIANDVLVVKEALEFMFNEGHKKLTIGSCCLEEYKLILSKQTFERQFPNVYEFGIEKEIYGQNNAGDYIRRSYRGGWCYLVKGKENKIYHKGLTADVNSLYPSMMSSESGNIFPIGLPYFWSGNYIPDEAIGDHRYFFIRVKTRFHIKEGYLPFIQIKGSWLYRGTESLETSDIYNFKTGEYNRYYLGFDGEVHDTQVILTMTMTDYYLFLEHYNVYDFEILDGCFFGAIKGIFDEYIDKYKKMKLESKGAMRELAKLFLNNLYGKMASNTDSSFKLAYIRDDQSIGYMPVTEYNKIPGYIPIGSAITSYARNFTIRTAQKNYHGKNKRGFIYADTDSIHCDLNPEDLVGVPIHDKNFCHWKLESYWDVAIFTRQKTYIEHVTHEDGIEIDEPYYNIKCAGMPQKCKHLFELSMKPDEEIDFTQLTDEEAEFVRTKRTLEDFKIGLCVPGKLIPKRIKGGTLLVETTYEMR